MKPLTLKRAEKALKEWQKRLRLRDWEIDISIVRAYELKEGTRAVNGMNDHLRTSSICLMDECDHNPSDLPYDWEQTLVHELLHIPIQDFIEDELPESKELALERAIEDISRALVTAKRDAVKKSKKVKA